MDTSPHICSRRAAMSSYGSPSTGMGATEKSCCLFMGYILLVQLPCLASEREEVLGNGHTGGPQLLRGEVEEEQGETVRLSDQEVSELDVT